MSAASRSERHAARASCASRSIARAVLHREVVVHEHPLGELASVGTRGVHHEVPSGHELSGIASLRGREHVQRAVRVGGARGQDGGKYLVA